VVPAITDAEPRMRRSGGTASSIRN
jgi:hypothetical protein